MIALLMSLVTAVAQPRERHSWRNTRGMIIQDPNVHDPVMAKEDSIFYIFYTGMMVPVMSSTDLINWRFEKSVFDHAPEWACNLVSGYRGHTWAPDIIYHKGKYHLFYSCSTFGKNTSAIGHAQRTTLNPADTLNNWYDTGIVVSSQEGKTDYNAIDPSAIIDDHGVAWLAYGSFWGGIQLVRLSEDLTRQDSTYQQITLARRERGKAIEAPFLFWHGGYYYLFVSWDYCCRGNKSDYKVVVGRSLQVEGPYLDRSGKAMLEGGGTIVYENDERMIAGGHCAAYTFDGNDYFICHGYTRERGESKLVLTKIHWDEDWPILD